MRTFFVFVIPAILLAGCGGAGQANAPSRGSYTGTYNSSNGDTGTAQLTISDSGSVTGSLDDTTAKKTATMNGSITNSEMATVQVVYQSSPTEQASGTFSKNSAGLFTGTLKSTSESLTFLLNK